MGGGGEATEDAWLGYGCMVQGCFFFLGIVWWFLVIADGVGLLIEGNYFFSGCVVEE